MVALSHGNQQWVQLAVALVHDPELLVLDEPFAGLDPEAVDSLSEVSEQTQPSLYRAGTRRRRLADSVRDMWSSGAVRHQVRHHGLMRQLQMGARVKRCRGYTAPDWRRKMLSTSAAARPC